MLRLAILASGGGSNLQAILDAFENGRLGSLEPTIVVTDRYCGAIERAMEAGVDAILLDRKIHGTLLSLELHQLLEEYRIDFVALAGWLSILDGDLTSRWEGRILNIHPSLLPLHGGAGMYGIRVHRAVLAAGDIESGCSVHIVSEDVDGGRVIGQSRVAVLAEDSPETLAARVLIEEHRLYPKVLTEYSESVLPRYHSSGG